MLLAKFHGLSAPGGPGIFPHGGQCSMFLKRHNWLLLEQPKSCVFVRETQRTTTVLGDPIPKKQHALIGRFSASAFPPERSKTNMRPLEVSEFR